MIIVWGSGTYGKCDEVPGIRHVATRFGHLWYIPLIPTATYAIIEKLDDGGFNGAKIPFSFKSFLLGWFRAACIVGLIFGSCITYVGFDVGDGWIPLIITLAILGALIGSYKLFGVASYERAKELGRHLGLTNEGRMLIEVAYGRMSPEELESRVGAESSETYEEEDPRFAGDQDDEDNIYGNPDRW